MLIIPAIDLKQGRCVRLRQGRMEEATVFGDDPLAMAQRWVDAGAQRLHIVDLDGAFAGEPRNVDRFTYAGGIRGDSNGCDTAGNSALSVAFSNLPADMATGIRSVVRGDIIDEDPCGYPYVDQFDYIVRAREVVALE